MSTLFVAVVVILLCAGLNRARGDDRWMPSWLPGRPLWYVAPAMGAVALLAQPVLLAAWLAVSYLVWALLAWGRWFDLGHLPAPTDKADPFEQAIERLSGGNDHLALFLRHLMMVPPLACAGIWPALLGLAFAAAATAAYEAAWRFHPSNPIWLAELSTGAAFGFLVIFL